MIYLYGHITSTLLSCVLCGFIRIKNGFLVDFQELALILLICFLWFLLCFCLSAFFGFCFVYFTVGLDSAHWFHCFLSIGLGLLLSFYKK